MSYNMYNSQYYDLNSKHYVPSDQQAGYSLNVYTREIVCRCGGHTISN